MKGIKKRLGNYLRGGLAGLVLAAGSISGCGDVYQEVFRHDDQKNIAPLISPIEIDYKEHDKKQESILINNRAYLKDDAKPRQILEKVVDVPLPIRYKIPAINATYTEDGNDGIILQYKSRLPAPDLAKLIQDVGKETLQNIKINTYQNQNRLVFSGKKQAFGFNVPEKIPFADLTGLLTEFDLPAVQVRVKLSIVEYFNDNTYDRDLVLDILKNNMKLLHLNLPSNPDPTADLETGINVNPFYNHVPKIYSLGAAVKFLDSYGKAKVLSEVDVLASNGETVSFKNTSDVPYPEALVAGNLVHEVLKYRETGTTIEVTPFANDQGFITIKVPKAETGEQTGWYGTYQRPTFRTASLGTGFVVREGVPYFAATSLFTRYKEVRRGIPLISQLPVLGDLTSSLSIENNQSQLLYFIEARVIGRESHVGTRIIKVEEGPPAELKEIEEATGAARGRPKETPLKSNIETKVVEPNEPTFIELSPEPKPELEMRPVETGQRSLLLK